VQLAGTRNGLVPDLPLVAVPEADAPAPVEGVFGNERREDFERIGVAALQLYQRDIAFFGALRTFHRPERYPDADATADAVQHAQLAYQLYASRLVKFLSRAVPELIGQPGAEQVAAALKQRVVAFLSRQGAPFPAQRVGVAAKRNADDPALVDLKLRVGPEMRIAGRDVNVLLAFSARL
jgi:predicted component of type VI protein secretion system